MPGDLGRLGAKHKTEDLSWLVHVNVEDFLSQLGVENISTATIDERKFSCPFSGHSAGDNNPSAFMNTGERDKKRATRWHCHGCKRSGTAISFYAEHEGVTYNEAKTWVREHYAKGWREPKGGSISAEFEERYKARIEALEYKPEKSVISKITYADIFGGVSWQIVYEDRNPEDIYAYLSSRGFTWQTLDYWNFGWDEQSDRITIPIVDHEGDIVGVKARTIKPVKKFKYLNLGDKGTQNRYGFPPYDKSHYMFGVYQNLGARTWVLTEGELDVISLWQMGIPAMASGSSSVSDIQLKIIRDYADELIVMFDDDESGEHAMWGFEKDDGTWSPGLYEKLHRHLLLRVVGSHDMDANDHLRAGKQLALRRLIRSAPRADRLVISQLGD